MTTAGSREINVTPLIDVLLVLLIIFIVMMPIMLRSETVELPPHAPPDTVQDGIVMELKLDADLTVALDDAPAFPNDELASRLRGKLPTVKAIFVNFVDGIPWHEVISTVDTIRGVAQSSSRTDLAVAVRLRGE